MAEEQLTRSRRLLELKGVAIEEEPPEPKTDSEWILQQYQKKREDSQLDSELDTLEKDILALLKKKLEKAT